MNITEIDKYKNEQQFYGVAQNRYENYLIQKTEHGGTQNRHDHY